MADRGNKRKKIRVSPDSPYASSEELERGFDQRLPSAISSASMRERSPLVKMSPRPAPPLLKMDQARRSLPMDQARRSLPMDQARRSLPPAAARMDLFRGEEGRRGSRYAEKIAEELAESDSGYKKGGNVKAKKAKKVSKPKVRGAGKAMKGVRPAKMVAMKGA